MVTWRKYWRLILSIGLVAVGVTVPAAPAAAALSATPVVVADADDVPTPLDMAEVSYSADTQFLTLTVRTYEAFADPATSFSWLLDTDDDGAYDYDVDASFDAVAGLVGSVSPRTGSTSAPAQVSRPTASSLTVRVALTLVNNPQTLTYQTVASVDTNNDGIVQNGESDVAGLDGQGDLVLRFAGADRIATSVAISEVTFFDAEANAVVLAVSTNFADALAGSPLAAARTGPLLLTAGSALDPRTENEIRRVLPPGRPVFLLGGTAALAPAVADRLTGLGYAITRFGGTTRFETAIDIAERGLGNPLNLLLSTGATFADGLSAGAAATTRGGALLLTDGAVMPASVTTYLQGRPAAQLFAVGGPAAAAAPTATPLVGANRYDTSRIVATFFFLNPSRIGITTGENFPDALSGGANMALVGGPLLLTPPGGLAAETAQYLTANAGTIVVGAVYGGRLAVADVVRTAVATAIK